MAGVLIVRNCGLHRHLVHVVGAGVPRLLEIGTLLEFENAGNAADLEPCLICKGSSLDGYNSPAAIVRDSINRFRYQRVGDPGPLGVRSVGRCPRRPCRSPCTLPSLPHRKARTFVNVRDVDDDVYEAAVAGGVGGGYSHPVLPLALEVRASVEGQRAVICRRSVRCWVIRLWCRLCVKASFVPPTQAVGQEIVGGVVFDGCHPHRWWRSLHRRIQRRRPQHPLR